MTMQELWNKVNNENGGKIADLIFYLYERWQDEKEYEDTNDYLKAIQKEIPQAYKIHKRPFGITCKCANGNIQISVKAERTYLKLVAKSV